MTITKEIGKIEKATFGKGGYQDAMIGLTLVFCSNKSSWGCSKFYGAWAIEHTKSCKWTNEERVMQLGEAVMVLNDTLNKAKKNHVGDLVGTPVECTFEGMQLKEWRVLEEVL